ncbi:hypothetical protein LTR17_005699 [Elasticomyces elasticus]|nr:hypothetical protein LTR17_005699 [Elasticomyces elasticus]
MVSSSRSRRDNRRTFPLFKLPPEIRIIIYEFALRHPLPLDLTQEAGGKLRLDMWTRFSTTRLLRVCKEVNVECAPILYSTNIFKLRVTNSGSKVLTRFLVKIGKTSVQALRHIVLEPLVANVRGWHQSTVKLIESANKQLQAAGGLHPDCSLTLCGRLVYSKGVHRMAMPYSIDLSDTLGAWKALLEEFRELLDESDKPNMTKSMTHVIEQIARAGG